MNNFKTRTGNFRSDSPEVDKSQSIESYLNFAEIEVAAMSVDEGFHPLTMVRSKKK